MTHQQRRAKIEETYRAAQETADADPRSDELVQAVFDATVEAAWLQREADLRMVSDEH